MPKPALVATGAAGAIALAVVLGVLALRDKRPPSAPPEEPEPVTESVPVEPTTLDVKPPRLLPSRVPAPTDPDAGKLLDEASLLTKLHELAASDPPESLRLAKEAVDRFPDSPRAPEFQWNVVKALFNMRRLEEAKDEARIMLWKYPGNSFTGDVEHHLLSPPPNPSDTP